MTLLKLDLEKEFCPEYSHEMLESDVNDNYRTFKMLESQVLENLGGGPSSQVDCFSQFQLIDAKSKARLVETYYSLDPELCRYPTFYCGVSTVNEGLFFGQNPPKST